MWSRVVEFMLGCWLAISPFVFGHGAQDTAFWINDLACAAAVMVLSLLSYWRPLRHAHLLIAAVGVWMIVFGYMHFGGPVPPAVQNDVIVGVLLIMFAVIPNRADEPPASWRKLPSANLGGEESLQQSPQPSTKPNSPVREASGAR